MSGFNAARQMGNSHQSVQEAVKRLTGLDLLRNLEKNPLFCLVLKHAMHRARIIQHARDCHIYRAVSETPATGVLNALAEFMYNQTSHCYDCR